MAYGEKDLVRLDTLFRETFLEKLSGSLRGGRLF